MDDPNRVTKKKYQSGEKDVTAVRTISSPARVIPPRRRVFTRPRPETDIGGRQLDKGPTDRTI
jgi:hypothetical protein